MRSRAKIILLFGFLVTCFGSMPADSLSPNSLENIHSARQSPSILTNYSSTFGESLSRISTSKSLTNDIDQKIKVSKIKFELKRASNQNASEENAGQETQESLNTVDNVYSCDLASGEESCCFDETQECLHFSFREILINGDIPTEALQALNAISSSSGWVFSSTPFERSIGYCLRSSLYEICFDQNSHKIVAYDWIRNSEGRVEISNPREFDTKLLTEHD